jgi:hypothetical protein
MNALERLLVAAKSVSHQYVLPVFREIAARDAVKLPRLKNEEFGEGKVLASIGVRYLMRGLAKVQDANARRLLAEALGLACDAIRAEPSPQTTPRPDPAPAREHYWNRD